MGLPDLTVQLLVFRVLALLIIVPVHGLVVAGTAVLLGDKGPKYDGRVTVVPASHIDLAGAIGLVVFGLGWGKPVDVDAGQLRTGRLGIVVVILAGFAGLLVLSVLLTALIPPALTTLSHTAALTTAAFLRACGSLSIWVALLGLVPIPPLAGGMLLGAYGIRVPRQAEWVLVALLFVAVATGVARQLLEPAHDALASVILGT